MNRYFLQLSFDGSTYHGWQRQQNAISVQQTIEEALSSILRTPIEIVGAGRTDTGVHAKNYFAHFDCDTPFSDKEISDLVYHLNAVLPNDIAIANIKRVKMEAHARFSAVSRTYRYYISSAKNPFTERYAWQLSGVFDVAKMNEAASLLQHHSDFTSFAKLHSDVKTHNCEIKHALWEKNGESLVFTITADRFLRNMVRAIVGTLLDAGKHKISVEEFETIVRNKNRSEAGYSVPAKGLFLEHIQYPEEIFI